MQAVLQPFRQDPGNKATITVDPSLGVNTTSDHRSAPLRHPTPPILKERGVIVQVPSHEAFALQMNAIPLGECWRKKHHLLSPVLHVLVVLSGEKTRDMALKAGKRLMGVCIR